MAVEVPEERVYYYECSAGRFRLVSFLPRAELERLVEAGEMNSKALAHYPDGLDLDCTEADFDEFAKVYDYRPSHGPEKLRAAFLAIFSSTENWRQFRGSGFLPAADLEACLAPATRILEESPGYGEAEPATRDLAAPPEPGLRGRSRSAAQRQLSSALEELEVDGVDPNKSLREQTFSKIRMSKGEPAAEFFAKVSRQRS